MKSINEIIEVLRDHKGMLREKYGVKEIGVFGSYVRGQQRRRSDLDVLVEFDEVPGLLKFIELEIELSKILGVKVDFVRKKSIREGLREKILKEAVMI